MRSSVSVSPDSLGKKRADQLASHANTLRETPALRSHLSATPVALHVRQGSRKKPPPLREPQERHLPVRTRRSRICESCQRAGILGTDRAGEMSETIHSDIIRITIKVLGNNRDLIDDRS